MIIEFEFDEHEEVDLKISLEYKAPHACFAECLCTFLALRSMTAAYLGYKSVDQISKDEDRDVEVEDHFKVG